jgi:hypothetical protein
MSQIKLNPPVVKNAACHPYRRATNGMSNGAMSEAALVPELKIPVARARSPLCQHE